MMGQAEVISHWEEPGTVIEFTVSAPEGAFVASQFFMQSSITISGLNLNHLGPYKNFSDYVRGVYFDFKRNGAEFIYAPEPDAEALPLLIGQHPADISNAQVLFFNFAPGDFYLFDLAKVDFGLIYFNFNTSRHLLEYELYVPVYSLGLPVFVPSEQPNEIVIGLLVDPLNTITGDVNEDGKVDSSDIDFISKHILAGVTDGRLDLNGDTVVNQSDRNYLITTILRTLPGDANLDHCVDAQDFNLWNESRFTNPTSWATGDFSGDGSTDAQDFNIWLVNKFRCLR